MATRIQALPRPPLSTHVPASLTNEYHAYVLAIAWLVVLLRVVNLQILSYRMLTHCNFAW